MWKDYSIGFIKRNRASSVSVIVAAFISALFLSLLCCMFYNYWNYEIESVVLEDGDWQGRISVPFEEDVVPRIENFANVKAAEINNDMSDSENLVIDIWFYKMETIYRDMPLIAEQLGVPEEAASYHEVLLSDYLINNPKDTTPPMLLVFSLALLIVVSVSLILIIHNSFAVSMNARVHQFGIFSSIGATPGQICVCLLQEASMLCLVPVIFGSFIGIGLSFCVIQIVNVLAASVAGRHEAVFTYSPTIFAITIVVSVVTVFFSAWIPARKLSRLTPLEAIKNSGELQLKKRKSSRILKLLFGMEGELAGNALKAQKRALRTSTLSLTLSFLGFTAMLCFFTLSGISTDHTYFERYQDSWDVMATVKDANIDNLASVDMIHAIHDTDSIIYQKANAYCSIPTDRISNEVSDQGGITSIAGNAVSETDNAYLIKAPIIIMDDGSYEKYCQQLGFPIADSGSIILNRVWDSVNSNFRYKEYIPFLSEEMDSVILLNQDREASVTIPVTGYTHEPPVLREEYDNYTLVQFISESTWEKIRETVGNADPDIFIRVLSRNGRTITELNTIETDLTKILGNSFEIEMENRIQERIDNDAMLNGYKIIIAAVCGLLAMIGIANVFSNTLGFIRQRKREFARYMSIGMTPEGMRKMFIVEALVIAGRPILITIPATMLLVWFMISASYLDPMEFISAAPIIPVMVFVVTIFGFVALAYYLGGRKIMNCDLVEALRSDYMG